MGHINDTEARIGECERRDRARRTSRRRPTDAAAAFVDRARSRHGNEIVELYVFGSTVRGDAHGRASDVDVFIVLDEETDRDAIADSLRDIALDVTIEYGPAVELHMISETTFDRYRREGNPFIRNVVTEGRSYA